jgi:Sortase domain
VPAVFAKLSTLAKGAAVEIVSAEGTQQTWTVTDTESVAYNSHPAHLFKRWGAPMLSLVTCAGSWSSTAGTYTQRLVVDASPA